MSLTVTDIFAGAGGSSTGMTQVPGVEIRMAANHSQLAVDVHNANHPTTVHACVDLHLEDPRNFPKTDILWASPECTKWSIANNKAKALSVEMGGDPTLFDDVPDDLQSDDAEAEANRSRLLMFDVLRFIEHHGYRAGMVENVVDIAMQAKYRPAWQSWQRGVLKLGYKLRVISLNSMHAQTFGRPAPQSRDRVYIGLWPEGERAPDFDQILRPQAWCGRCERIVESQQSWKNGRTVGRYRAQYVYIHGEGCGQIVEPAWLPASVAIDWTLPGRPVGDLNLADKTRARIAAGIERYWGPLEIPVEGRDGKEARPMWLPGRTQTTRNETALLVPAGGTWNDDARSTHEPFRAFTTREAYGVVQPFIAELRGGSSDARPISDPLCTVTGSGNHHGLVMPYYGASEYAKPTSEPIGTLTTVDRYALIMRHNTGGAEMLTPATEPMRTLTTVGHQSVVRPGVPASAVDECTFRMLQPHEIAAGMAFPDDYIWQGNKRQRVKLMGNAVTPPSSRDLVHAVVDSLGGAA